MNSRRVCVAAACVVSAIGCLALAAPVGGVSEGKDFAAASVGTERLLGQASWSEPATMLLFGAGLIGVARRVRRS